MSTNWPLHKLEDLTELARPITYGVVKPGPEDPDGGVKFIRGGDIFEGRIAIDSLRTITKGVSNTYSRTLLSGGELVVSLVGNPGHVAVVPKVLAGANLARQSGLIALREEISADFIKYYLMSPQGRAELFAQMTGSVQIVINLHSLRTVRVPLPPLLIQQQIAGILSAYDELIANNQRRIKILESMARAIYREWFVHFRFPGHENVARVSSPFGEFPQGWEVKRIGDSFRTVLGGTPSRATPEFWDSGTISWINSGKVNDLRIIEASELITPLALEKSAAKLMPKGTTVLAITGATLGQVSFLEIETAANQSVLGIVDPAGDFSEWIYLTVTDRIEGIINHASGGAQQHINKDVVNDVKVCFPPHQLAADFKGLAAPMFREIATLLFKVKNLRRTRDLLLPRLLSGQVDLEVITE